MQEESDSPYLQLRKAIRDRNWEYLRSNQTTISPISGLFTAAVLNVPEALEYFLSQGANINDHREENECRTPLMAAAEIGSAEAVEYLLSHGAIPNLVDKWNRTALHMAEAKKHHKAVAIFQRFGVEPTMLYLWENDRESFKKRLELPNALIDVYGRSVIPELFRAKQDNLAKELLETHKSLINVPGREWHTCLHIAIMRKNRALVQYLLEQGADPNCEGEQYSAVLPIMLAVNLGRIDLVDILLNFGAKINIFDIYGSSVLMHAISENNPKMVKFLLDRGADPMLEHGEPAPDYRADTNAWEAAKSMGNKKMIALLTPYVTTSPIDDSTQV